ncbi:MAG: fibrobacter succinogenes major paralogous domain-containing protein [Bacteroidales bacterium]|nr:fibrobacter succinogenes major paralogous domain-containing protein [Bacteroidales bacterium]
MKRIFITTIAIICLQKTTAQQTPDKFDCIAETPGMTTNMGIISFKTNRTWKVGTQEWSDAVTTSKCKKNEFQGVSSGKFNADCRENPGYGDLFSWCAVSRFQNQLCPAPWRVPTKEDFIVLDIALGGDGEGYVAEKEITEYRVSGYGKVPSGTRKMTQMDLLNEYLNSWGGTFGGKMFNPDSFFGSLGFTSQGRSGYYWTQTKHEINSAYSMYFSNNGIIQPLTRHGIQEGLLLRCVRGTIDKSLIYSFWASTQPKPDEFGCISETPGMTTDVGIASFVSDRTWTVGNQTWSDAVTATKCQKERFRGFSDILNHFNADCRSNPGERGDLFSWCAVARFQNQLCPSPWRVPTIEDFKDLDLAMGGTGNTRWRATEKDIQFVENNYITRWGGDFSGFHNERWFVDQGKGANYWSSSFIMRDPEPVSSRQGPTMTMTPVRGSVDGTPLYLRFDSDGGVGFTVVRSNQANGKTLRCVRDK